MDKCIHSSCSCKEYKEPKGSKGTLLQLKTGCQVCGHQASLHRKLTSVDRYIQDEVKKVKKVSCRHLIPAHEIPRSPLFEQYDLIPLPTDDQCTSTNQEGGVQCTCKGFETDLVRLWQKFRTHNVDYVRTELPKAACSFCHHALSKHLASESASDSTKPPLQAGNAQTIIPRNSYGQLSLKASANIALSVALGRSTSLLLPSTMEECKRMMTFVLHRAGDTKELELSLVTHSFRPTETATATTAQTSSDGTQCHNGGQLESLPPDEAGSQDSSSTSRKSRAAKRGTKRKSSENEPPLPPETKRRSVRIAALKQRKDEAKAAKFSVVDEQWLKKKRKGGSKLETLLEEKIEDAMTKSLSDSEVKHLSDNAVEFVQSLSKETSFRRCGKLPPEVSSESSVMVATHPVEIPCKQEDSDVSSSSSSASSLSQLSINLVAVASLDGCDVYAAPLLPDSTQSTPLWSPLPFTGSRSMKITSLSWTVVPERSPTDAYLCTGSSNGRLCVWRFRLKHTLTLCNFEEILMVVSVEDTKDQITACAWSSDRKTLAAGSISGDILFYSVDVEAAVLAPTVAPSSKSTTILKHMQIVHVCGGSVQCLAWSKDSRLIAVGGSDDYIQILQCKEPKCSSKPVAPSSLLNYFERDDTETRHRFVHTHSLRGHQSFIADLCFLGNSHRLVSIGWDSQLLIWNSLLLHSLPKSQYSSSSRTVHHNTQHKEQSAESLPTTEVEPIESFKLGPSASVEFLPLAVHDFLDCGLFVVLRNRLGVVYVVLYMRSLVQAD